MAQIGIDVGHGFMDKRIVQGQTSDVLGTAANYASHAALNARLTAINGTLYSAANLTKYTYNDKVYALRLNDDAAGI